MKILVFSDLHANKNSLHDLRPIIKEVDLSIFCGDILGYGTDIDESLDFVINEVDLAVMGNHDRMAISGESLQNQHESVKKSINYTRKHLKDEQVDLISKLPTEITFQDMYITHSLGDEYLREEKDFLKFYKLLKRNTKYAFFGHTHEQAFFEHNNTKIINPGSLTKGRRGFKRTYVIVNGDEIKFVELEDVL